MSSRCLALAALLAALLLGPACGASAIPHPTDAHLARARARWPETTRATLERGRELYVARCSGCHPLHAPSTQPAARWAIMVEDMAPRARLSPAERDLVLRYLTATSRR